ncbi:amidohydrolase [Thalassotalea sp. HSM 43]|uniref:amidohydrolase n=1 Tax=Thalassotalea sp. HSM 43 TaxID=2552945 RepID=UPI001082295F|nr:amidohydrolase [Thalassotalea sp. HSM 43]QBY05031.1 amidohydrolase [Thalassotalea sp. HSM 43]
MKLISSVSLALTTLLLVAGLSKTTDAQAQTQAQTKTAKQQPTSTIIYGGEIITMEKQQPSVEAVVVSESKIVFAGSLNDANKQHPSASSFDLKGKVLMPGFIEQHMHPFLGALTLQMVVIAPEPWQLPDKTWPAAKDEKDYITKLKAAEKALKDPSQILWSWGFNNFFHGQLSREKLDQISSTRPIVVWHRSCHEFYFNSAAVKLFGLKQADIDASGADVAAQSDLDKGHFYEAGAMVYLLPRVFPKMATPERMKAGLLQMREMLHQNGITAYMEPGAFIAPGTEQLYMDILGSEQTPFYSFFIPETKTPLLQYGADGMLAGMEEIKSIFPQDGKVRFLDKQVKILADGAIISQLMKMKDGYLDGHKGEWIQPPEEMETISKVFWEAGYQIHVHVNGDEGLEEVLDMFARRMKSFPREDHRGVIIHFANSTPEQVKRIKQLGLIVSANPYYVTGFAEKFAQVGLGKERAYHMVRLAPLEDQGTSISLHSDLPMAPADPLYLAWSAVTRQTLSFNPIQPELALSVDAAIRAITIEAAFSWGMEDTLGSIKTGKIANFTLIDQNPYTVKPSTIKDINVEGTFFQGKYFPIEPSNRPTE